nr:beta-propeller fold lactonase family protein [Paenibacillus sp. AR247]
MLQNVSTLPEDFTGESFCADIHISPCGRFLYGSNRGDDSIVLFHINESTGELTPVDWVSTGGEFPRNFAIISGYLIAADQNTGNMLSYKIDSDSGRLTPTGFALELPKPVCIQQWVKGE